MNGVPVDLISVNISTGELLYWTTVDDYFNGNSLVNTNFFLLITMQCMKTIVKRQ